MKWEWCTSYRYETLDYFLTQHRWKNVAKDVESDPFTVLSDHYPLSCSLAVKLKAVKTVFTPKPKYLKCTSEENELLNVAWSSDRPEGMSKWRKRFGTSRHICLLV